jgi:SAM-dependent methyltransferase
LAKINSAGGYGSNEFLSSIKTPIFKKIVQLLYPPMPTLNIIPLEQVRKISSSIFQNKGLILNVGSGGMNGAGSRLWDNFEKHQCRVINMDISPGSDVNIVSDAHQLPFDDNSIDSVVMQAVIEHLTEPNVAISEVFRVLKPGGVFYVEVPFLQGFHADPHDYQRYTLEGLRRRLVMFDEDLSGVSIGPFCTLVWLLRDGFSSCFNNRWLYLGTRFTLGWILSPIRYLDILVRHNPAAYRLANEYYYLCHKSK